MHISQSLGKEGLDSGIHGRKGDKNVCVGARQTPRILAAVLAITSREKIDPWFYLGTGTSEIILRSVPMILGIGLSW